MGVYIYIINTNTHALYLGSQFEAFANMSKGRKYWNQCGRTTA